MEDREDDPELRARVGNGTLVEDQDRPELRRPTGAEFTWLRAVVVLECWDDDTVTGDDFLGTVAVPLSEVTAGKQLDLPLLAATLARGAILKRSTGAVLRASDL